MGAGSDMTSCLRTSSECTEAALSTRLRRSVVVGTVEDARVALLSRLVDHAPLFPPASLPLPEALAEDERARESSAAFVLGRFVCPTSRLAELPEVGRAVSVVLDGPVETWAAAGDARVEAFESRMPDDLGALVALESEVYVEDAADERLVWELDALAEAGLRAKVRCGGASVPTTAELSRFVRGCAERGLVFKATAGLHHAVRRDGEHGFLNLLAAVVHGDEEDALAESDPGAFRLDPDGFHWRNRSAGPEEIARARRERLHSIGSCSFFEPVAELEGIGVLPL